MDILSLFLLGFFVKVVTGIDDMLTRVPVLAAVARSRAGKVAFSLGTIAAVSVATLIAYFFSEALSQMTGYRQIVAGLLFLLALCIHFDVFVHEPLRKAEGKVTAVTHLSVERMVQLFGIGFVASFLTVLDDVIAFVPVFLANGHTAIVGVAGILSATVLQALAVIYFAGFIARIPHKDTIAAVGLALLGIGILLGIV